MGYDLVIRGGRVRDGRRGGRGRHRRDERRSPLSAPASTAATRSRHRPRRLAPAASTRIATSEQMSGMACMNADTFETATRSAVMGGHHQRHLLRGAGQGGSGCRHGWPVTAARCRTSARHRHAFSPFDQRPVRRPSSSRPWGAHRRRAASVSKVVQHLNIGLDEPRSSRSCASRRAGALPASIAENDSIQCHPARLVAERRTRRSPRRLPPPRAEIRAVAPQCADWPRSPPAPR